ncbi:MAG: ThiF family adenylyltransferase [Acidobacteria bacterium]|nr:ThiF family adenylyltransferase [Acidobacteriota bacterium]
MVTADLELGGPTLTGEQLKLQRAQRFHAYCASGKHPYVTLVGCQGTPKLIELGTNTEVVIVDIEAQLPLKREVDLRRVERFAIIFQDHDHFPPHVLSLRSDFPEVVHLNPVSWVLPRSLCLSDIPWHQRRLNWTPHGMVESLRGWLSRTARGDNHQPEQTLEPPFLVDPVHLILPSTFFSSPPPAPTLLQLLRLDDQVWMLPPADGAQVNEEVVCLCLPVHEQTHGMIQRTPATLQDLAVSLLGRGYNLFATLRPQFQGWNEPSWHHKRLLLLLPFKLKRSANAAAESFTVWAVLTAQSIGDIGVAIGAWAKCEHGYGAVLTGTSLPPEPRIGIQILITHLRLDPDRAALCNGAERDRRRFLGIGAGALGSQVIDLLVRSGFGSWTIVDNDRLFPHNLARHALHDRHIGQQKSVALANELSGFMGNTAIPAVVRDILHSDVVPGYEELLAQQDVIVDLSASVAVARHIATIATSPARRMSFFLNPTGASSVLLFEDAERTIPLDVLELQYYRALLYHPLLRDHLSAPSKQVAFAHSCRDKSFQIANDLVTLHAGIGANAIRKASLSSNARIRIWEANEETRETRMVEVEPVPCQTATVNGWALVVDEFVLGRMAAMRKDRLPNETGGVLLGGWDTLHNRLYIVDVIGSPADSDEWPTGYLRGVAGLKEGVEEVSGITDGQLGYVGEWHSHPRGASSNASDDDAKVFTWLAEQRSRDGYPPVMAIFGERTSSWHVAELAAPLVLPINTR